MKKYDYSIEMSRDLISIDTSTFKSITLSSDELAKRMSRNPSYEIFIKYINDVPSGFISTMHVCTPHYEAHWIDLMAVSPDYQNNGVATEMIGYVKNYMNEYHPSSEFISALVRSSNVSSLRALENQGFKTDGQGSFELVFLG
ncbi:GNAT family N-acetyltransferase [Proteocatella sphenisci]|uniref:GNAT family N-acetyltransferase n=1 Tax=Proteocatella sphenisci TaxID=181070 RepID=UPI00048DC17E|nr:GNAT family N-acetyltransferase [Proteocatella sphenisci]